MEWIKINSNNPVTFRLHFGNMEISALQNIN